MRNIMTIESQVTSILSLVTANTDAYASDADLNHADHGYRSIATSHGRHSVSLRSLRDASLLLPGIARKES